MGLLRPTPMICVKCGKAFSCGCVITPICPECEYPELGPLAIPTPEEFVRLFGDTPTDPRDPAEGEGENAD